MIWPYKKNIFKEIRFFQFRVKIRVRIFWAWRFWNDPISSVLRSKTVIKSSFFGLISSQLLFFCTINDKTAPFIAFTLHFTPFGTPAWQKIVHRGTTISWNLRQRNASRNDFYRIEKKEPILLIVTVCKSTEKLIAPLIKVPNCAMQIRQKLNSRATIIRQVRVYVSF